MRNPINDRAAVSRRPLMRCGRVAGYDLYGRAAAIDRRSRSGFFWPIAMPDRMSGLRALNGNDAWPARQACGKPRARYCQEGKGCHGTAHADGEDRDRVPGAVDDLAAHSAREDHGQLATLMIDAAAITPVLVASSTFGAKLSQVTYPALKTPQARPAQTIRAHSRGRRRAIRSAVALIEGEDTDCRQRAIGGGNGERQPPPVLLGEPGVGHLSHRNAEGPTHDGDTHRRGHFTTIKPVGNHLGEIKCGEERCCARDKPPERDRAGPRR